MLKTYVKKCAALNNSRMKHIVMNLFLTCFESFLPPDVKSWHLLFKCVKESGMTSGLTLLSWKTDVWYWHEELRWSWPKSFRCNVSNPLSDPLLRVWCLCRLLLSEHLKVKKKYFLEVIFHDFTSLQDQQQRPVE